MNLDKRETRLGGMNNLCVRMFVFRRISRNALVTYIKMVISLDLYHTLRFNLKFDEYFINNGSEKSR